MRTRVRLTQEIRWRTGQTDGQLQYRKPAPRPRAQVTIINHLPPERQESSHCVRCILILFSRPVANEKLNQKKKKKPSEKPSHILLSSFSNRGPPRGSGTGNASAEATLTPHYKRSGICWDWKWANWLAPDAASC